MSNLLTAADSSFETGSVGTFTPLTICTLAVAGAGLQGTHSLQLTSTGSGTMSAASAHTGQVMAVAPLTAYTLLGSAHANVTVRSFQITVNWYDASLVSLGSNSTTAQNDVTSGWASSTANVTSPAGAAFASITVQVASVASSEVHLFDALGLIQGSGQSWVIGTGTYVAPPIAASVQLDLSGASFGAAFTPTDVSSWAAAGMDFAPVTVNWGRQDQYSTVTPSAGSLVYQGYDGRFAPGNVSSPYYPHIKRSLRRRILALINGTQVNLIDDYASALTVIPARAPMWTVQHDGQDILARYGGTQSSDDPNQVIAGTTMRSFLAEEILVDSPTALYMLQESAPATSFGDVTGVNAPATVKNSKYGAGLVEAGQTGNGNWTAGSLVQITNPAWTSGAAAGSWLAVPVGVTAPYSIELWVQVAAAPAATATVLGPATGAGSYPLLTVHTNGTIQLDDANGTQTGPVITDGNVHQVVITQSGSGGAFLLYVNGTLYDQGVTSSLVGLATSLQVGMNGTATTPQQPFTGSVAYLGVFGSVLTSTRITAHYNAGANAFSGERTDQRITRLLSYRANTGSVLDTGLGIMGAQDIQGRSLQDVLLEVGQVEAGAVFADGQGRINFRSRTRLFNPTPILTLDCNANGVDFASNFRDDTQSVINDATVTGSSGADQRFYNAASVTSDGEYSTSLQLPIQADTDALNMAGWIVGNGVVEQVTATPLVVDLLQCTPAVALGVAQLQPLDCIQVTNCPTGAPASTMTFLVQGGTLSIAADAVTATLNTTPVPIAVGVWDSAHWDATSPTWSF